MKWGTSGALGLITLFSRARSAFGGFLPLHGVRVKGCLAFRRRCSTFAQHGIMGAVIFASFLLEGLHLRACCRSLDRVAKILSRELAR